MNAGKFEYDQIYMKIDLCCSWLFAFKWSLHENNPQPKGDLKGCENPLASFVNEFVSILHFSLSGPSLGNNLEDSLV
ncbi:hypothetical protein NBRC116589_31310 [Ruegeria sp. HU-ET01832]